MLKFQDARKALRESFLVWLAFRQKPAKHCGDLIRIFFVEQNNERAVEISGGLNIYPLGFVVIDDPEPAQIVVREVCLVDPDAFVADCYCYVPRNLLGKKIKNREDDSDIDSGKVVAHVNLIGDHHKGDDAKGQIPAGTFVIVLKFFCFPGMN